MLQSLAMRRSLFGHGEFAESILGRFTLIVLYAVVWSLALFLLILLEPAIPLVLFKYLLLVALGAGTGLLARRLLSDYSLTFSWLTTVFAELVALFILFDISQGFIGVGPLSRYQVTPGWDPFLQLLTAGATSWLALRLLSPRRFSLKIQPEAPVQPLARPRPPRVAPVRNQQPTLGQRLSSWQASTQASLRRAPASLGARLKESFTPLTELVFPPAGRSRVKPKKKPKLGSASKNGFRPVGKAFTRRKRSPIHLSQVEEHRCPYCLDQVVKGDPRGVHICKVCHTWHHQDCWDVAGVCQVPHEYA